MQPREIWRINTAQATSVMVICKGDHEYEKECSVPVRDDEYCLH